MDIRGIEVTNQLRSAIRAKLLELGVRYDEELPDYILVMVVNKKTRQQMHEDLHLFLENNTAPFVDWLHDQVLKKLQKVTIAKKKVSREFVPAVIIKQEEQRKKNKTTTSFLEDHNTNDLPNKLIDKPLKEDKDIENEPTKSEFPSESNEQQNSKNDTKEAELKEKTTISSTEAENSTVKKITVIDQQKSKEVLKSSKSQPEPGTSKPINETVNHSEVNTSTENSGKRSQSSNEEDDLNNSKKLKSSIAKPKITSVVSVKNRLGIISLSKKSDSHSDREISFKKPKHERITTISTDDHPHEYTDRRNNYSRSKNIEFNADSRKSRNFDMKIRDKTIDIKNRLGSFRDNKSSQETIREIIPDKSGLTIKNRLGSSSGSRVSSQSSTKKQETIDERRIDRHERSSFRGKNVKYRLGPIKKTYRLNDSRNSNPQETRLSNFKDTRNSNHKDRNSFQKEFPFKRSGNYSNLSFKDDANNEDVDDDDDDDDKDKAAVNAAPVKSHIVAVQKPSTEKSSRKRLKSNEDVSDEDEEEVKECKVPSKVIVTPRPLKPLPSTQKRATQSLLLRAVAEANQSVVSQKNPEPSLVEVKPPVKRLKPSGSWTGGQNLSVHLDSQKRFVMENIQIELTTVTDEPHQVTDEHIGVVRSLFQQSNNDQKFLVTLNGYNNNLPQEKSSDENEENLDTELNDCEEQEESVYNPSAYQENESDIIAFHVSNTEDDDKEDDESSNSKLSNNDENQNTENINDTEEPPKKSRKLSPIVYNKSRSPTPEISTKKSTISSVIISTEKKSKINTVSVSLNSLMDEKCRYWPNCTLGKKCAYIHPDVPCSLFPTCKFGANCQYLHPRCKFGLSCTKAGCIFSHPPEKCKYHPYCTNPSCSFSHPSMAKSTHLPQTTRRDKFTWRRQN
ncbi:zinc finger CCCH domain-containing protein 14 isoform X2 [Leptopilina heterotoma]|uniref:zinc finger CCCH domain-containing protein 14 isoform X2 n=1 Tax=Leptopilina heterotoma TaxID=63436 RepID=UPI001CA93326|nr:zinc finger CCCH domain-containing protein 14 isoform X2 [Leptopilina heterotoma]